MAAAKVTNLEMPPKVTGDELLATEVEAIRRALNSHADDLDNGPELAKVLTLLATQALATSSKVDAGVLYRSTGNWNAAGTDSAVFLHGLSAGAFASTGWVVDSTGKAQAVAVDVAAGTWEPIVDTNEYLQGDADGNILIGLRGNGSSIVGGVQGLLVGGEDNHVVDGVYNAIFEGSANQIEGGTYNQMFGCQACSIPATCSNVTLINCQAFTPPAGASNVTYIDNQLAGSGGSGNSIPFTYPIQASDVTSPASDIVIAIPEALSFGAVYIEVPNVTGMDRLAPSNYSGAPGQLTLSASISPALQPGDIVHVYYQEGTAASGGGGGAGTVKAIKQGPTTYQPDADGLITLPAAADSVQLNFAFDAGFANDVTRVITASTAGAYTVSDFGNIASASYQLNFAAAQPLALNATLALASGDTLRFDITRNDAAKGSVLQLSR